MAQDWDQPLAVTPAEQLFGVDIIPRPQVVDWPTNVLNQVDEERWIKLNAGHLPPGIDPDLSKPFYLSTGQIIEPVKFALAKDEHLRDLAYSQIAYGIFSGVFARHLDPRFALGGQMLATYNDLAGVRMYRAMGFKHQRQIKPQLYNGIEWHLLLMRPIDFLETIEAKNPHMETSAQEFFRYLQMSSKTTP